MAGEPSQKYSKDDARYWKARLYHDSYSMAGTRVNINDWSVRIQHAGHRAAFSLGTANKDTAAKKAKILYQQIRTHGWDAVVAAEKKSSPAAAATPAIPTVGNVIEILEQRAAHLGKRTLGIYSRHLRLLAASVKGIAGEPSKFDHRSGCSAWRKKVDALPLDILTAAAVRDWQTRQLQAVGNDPVGRRRRVTTLNSVLSNARKCFGTKMLCLFADARLPVTANPLAEAKLLPNRPARYVSRIDPAALLKSATETIAGTPRYRVILLALLAGLRRGEIDRLTWSHVDLDRKVLRVLPSAAGDTKTASSVREVDADDFLSGHLDRWKKTTRGRFVVPGTGKGEYRSEAALEAAVQWLKANGVDDPHPLHLLRKEAGSLVAKRHGLHAAADLLGHSDFRTVTSLYVAKKERISTGLGTDADAEKSGQDNKARTT